MLERIAWSALVGVVWFLACLLIGALLEALGIPVLTTVGKFLEQWAVVIGVLAAVIYFLSGRLRPF